MISVSRDVYGTRLVELVTDEDTAAACPSCGIFSTSVKEHVSTRPKDIPSGQDRIPLRWNKTRWGCREDYCTRASFTEAIEQIPRRGRTIGRLRTPIGDAARSVDGPPPTTRCPGRRRTAHSSNTPIGFSPNPSPVRVLEIDDRTDSVGVHREERTPHAAIHREVRWRPAIRPGTGCTPFSPGASSRTSPNSSPSHAPSIRSGRRSTCSSAPGSPMLGPRASNAPRVGSRIVKTPPTGCASTAPAPSGPQPSCRLPRQSRRAVKALKGSSP
ncbi:transposase family protein [Rhodococcus jostii]|uniref:transposase family protein n=1 Tax=Rhodococcus jostii TaxID=132919 RepID=UPI00364E3F01